MNWVRILRDITTKPQVHWNAYQIYCRYHSPRSFLSPDPTCKRCKGTGVAIFQIGEDDIEKDACLCIEQFNIW